MTNLKLKFQDMFNVKKMAVFILFDRLTFLEIYYLAIGGYASTWLNPKDILVITFMLEPAICFHILMFYV